MCAGAILNSRIPMVVFGARDTAAGALGGSMADVGIDDDFIDSVKSQVVPGTSALFLMTQDAVIDRVSDAFDGTNAQLVKTNLSKDQEEALRSAFADED